MGLAFRRGDHRGRVVCVARERRRRSRRGGGVGFRRRAVRRRRATRAVVRDACARAPGQQSGIAILAACGPGGVRSRAWAGAGGSAKARGAVALALARCVDANESVPRAVRKCGRVRTRTPIRTRVRRGVRRGRLGVGNLGSAFPSGRRRRRGSRDTRRRSATFARAFLGKPDAFAGAGGTSPRRTTTRRPARAWTCTPPRRPYWRTSRRNTRRRGGVPRDVFATRIGP